MQFPRRRTFRVPALVSCLVAFAFGAQAQSGVDLEKFTNGQNADTAPGPAVTAGSTVNWTYVVTNPGTVPVSNVVVTDDNGTPGTGDDWLPHFACRAVGEALVEAMAAHPECEMTALCGHTHSPGEAQILPNLRVLTGGAEYGRPEVQRVLTVP